MLRGLELKAACQYTGRITPLPIRVAQLYGINLNATILSITRLNLGAPAGLIINGAVALKGGGLNAVYRHAAAGVFNFY